MDSFFNNLAATMGDVGVELFLGLLVLIGGWLISFAVATVIRKVLERINFDNTLATWMGNPSHRPIRFSLMISRALFFSCFIIVLIAFFRIIGFSMMTEPLTILVNQVFAFLPKVLGALVVILIAWILATVLRFIVQKVLHAANIDNSLGLQDDSEEAHALQLSTTIATIVYWLVLLLFLPVLLGTLGLEGVISPVQVMLEGLLGFLPNALGAALISLFGWLFARILRQIVTSGLSSVKGHEVGQQMGLQDVVGARDVPFIIGRIVYVMVLIPTIIAALNALRIEAISTPATEMLSVILSAVPFVIAAGVVIIVAYLFGRLVRTITTNLLTKFGFNEVFGLIGVTLPPSFSPAHVAGTITFIILMLFALIEASQLLGFSVVASLTTQLVEFFARILLAFVILGAGIYLANVTKAVVAKTSYAPWASAVRMLVVILSSAIAFAQTGIATTLVNIIITLILGAVALAFALAVGLGSKEIAGREIESLIAKIKQDKK